jgi:hypothetical protein
LDWEIDMDLFFSGRDLSIIEIILGIKRYQDTD